MPTDHRPSQVADGKDSPRSVINLSNPLVSTATEMSRDLRQGLLCGHDIGRLSESEIFKSLTMPALSWFVRLFLPCSHAGIQSARDCSVRWSPLGCFDDAVPLLVIALAADSVLMASFDDKSVVDTLERSL